MLTGLAQWLPWVGLALGMCALWCGTTYFWLRLARVPAPAAFIAAPPTTSALILPLSLFYERWGVFWSGARVLPVLALIGMVGGILFMRSSPRFLGRTGFRMRFASASFAGAVAVGWLLAALPTMVTAPPINPPQQWDPSFHLNGVWGITQLGIGAPGTGLAHNYGGQAPAGYPIGWHAFTSLFATPTTTVQTGNASSLALMLLWVVGSAVFTYVLYPSRRVTLAAAVIAGTLPSMPADALTMYSQWPNATSVVFMPGGAVLMILAGRSLMTWIGGERPSPFVQGVTPRSDGHPGSVPSHADRPALLVRRVTAPDSGSWRTTLSLALLVVIVTVGGIQAHQVYAFNMLVLLLPAVVAGAVLLVKNSLRTRRWWITAVIFSLAVLGTALVVWIQFRPEISSMRRYPRYGVDWSTGISQALIPNPPFPDTLGLTLFNVVMGALLFFGILRVVLARYVKRWWAVWPGEAKPLGWPVWSYILYAFLVFSAYGPPWDGRKWIVGPWFLDGRRIMEPQSLILIPLLAIGYSWIAMWCVRWWTTSVAPAMRNYQRWISLTLGGLLLVISGFGGMSSRVGAARQVFDPEALGKSGMATQGVLDMMRTLPDLLPEDAVVLGDPQAGAMYAQMIGQRWAYFPQLALRNPDSETKSVLVERFGDLVTDEEVCEAIHKAGITHFFSAPDGAYYGRLRSDRMPGLYNVDVSQGFELVAQGDEARLYKITACGLGDD